CRRRPRARNQEPVWALHVVAVESPGSGVRGPESPVPTPDPGPRTPDFEYETDRAQFLGRGRTAANPAALDTRAPLSGTVGPVLDPVFSLRRRVRLAPGASAVLAFT